MTDHDIAQSKRLLRTGAAAALTLLGLTAATNAQDSGKAMLLLDHSGSMWAQIEGTAKVSIMRDAVGAMFGEYAGKLDIGLLAYGAQKNKNCESIDTLKPVSPVESKNDADILTTVKPNGAAAIGASLSAAAGQFDAGTRNRTLVLISDSTDDCKADPCAIATSLKEKYPGLVAHVVGFTEQDTAALQPLSCIAENTGGTFRTASTASELNDALRETFKITARGPSPDGSAASTSNDLPGTATDPVTGGKIFLSDDPGALVLSAIMAEGAGPLSSGLIWRIYSIEIQSDGSYKLLNRYDDAQIAATLPPGDYLVNVSYGQAHATKRVTVWPGKRDQDVFNLKAGGLRLYATLAKEPLLADHALTFSVYSEETDQFGNRRRVVANAKSGVVLRLNTGSYRVVSKYGDANSLMEVDVTVEPGKLTEATIDHQAGKVTFRLVERQGGEALADTIWHIFSSDGELVRRSGGAFPTHVLAAGDYSVRVEHGGREYAAKFAVGVGDKQQVEVIKP